MDIDTEVKYNPTAQCCLQGVILTTYALTRGYLCSLQVTASNFLPSINRQMFSGGLSQINVV
ncbi:hypothetical protein AVR70_03615 [Escherichia coli]|nr:hypothetical protein AVR70_03615 [Escherichia coli]